ncbi:MAG TPA: transposase [Solirubrobacteraceae bacterium]|jgi:hypothetical protein
MRLHQHRTVARRPGLNLSLGEEAQLIVGIDVHKHDHAAALIDERGAQIAALWLPNSPAGYRRLIDWLFSHQAAAGFEVLQVPAWRTHRERHARDLGTYS